MSAAPKMTIRQIASAAGCHHDTVRQVVRRLYPDFSKDGVRQEFDAHQSATIMMELPKRNMVGEIAKKLPYVKPQCNLTENRKPSVSLLRECRLAVKERFLTAWEAKQLLGFDPILGTIGTPENPVQLQLGILPLTADRLDREIRRMQTPPGQRETTESEKAQVSATIDRWIKDHPIAGRV